MKSIIIILLSLTLTNSIYAQQDRGERVKAIRVAFITDRLHLSADQSARFWPVFNQYTEEVQKINREFNQKYKKIDIGSADDATAREYIEDTYAKEEKHLALKRKYRNEYLKIISAQQLAQLFSAEHDFNKLLVDQLKEPRK